jgi:two-component system, OmpR family, sensor histidine kinase KdpD
VTSTPDEVTIRVADSGPGIPVHEQERIFEPFVHGIGLHGARGSGLGLAIARGFVDVNGGRLFVEEAEGRGAAFVVVLPAAMLPLEVGG